MLDALTARQVRRARRPLVLLGAIGPAAVLLVMSLFAWWSFDLMLDESDDKLQELFWTRIRTRPSWWLKK